MRASRGTKRLHRGRAREGVPRQCKALGTRAREKSASATPASAQHDAKKREEAMESALASMWVTYCKTEHSTEEGQTVGSHAGRRAALRCTAICTALAMCCRAASSPAHLCRPATAQGYLTKMYLHGLVAGGGPATTLCVRFALAEHVAEEDGGEALYDISLTVLQVPPPLPRTVCAIP